MASAMSACRLGPNEFAKYHALGNDYLVLDGTVSPWPTAALIARLCARHRGLGSDGLLVLRAPTRGGAAGLRIYNPDGSEAEKSGNGLRIFARFLADTGYVQTDTFVIELRDEDVPARLIRAPAVAGASAPIDSIAMGMGTPRITYAAVGAPGGEANSTRASIKALDATWDVSLVSMGNPHCVVFGSACTESLLRALGPALEQHVCFANRINVQLVRVIDRHCLQLLIWERGAGVTEASGSSSCAAVAAAQARGLCGEQIEVRMPGGAVQVRRENGALWLHGGATPVARMRLWEDQHTV